MVRQRQGQAKRTQIVLVVLVIGAVLAGALVLWPSGTSYEGAMPVPFQGADVPQPLPTGYQLGTPWFDPEVAEALSGELARAIGDADLCIGWDVTEEGFRSFGSNQGAGVPANACDRWVVVAVALEYVPESSEQSDRAGLEVFASDDELQDAVDGAPGLTEGAGFHDLLGDDGDVATANVVAGVPLALASAGILEPIAVVAADAAEAPAADGTDLGDDEGEDGNDALHQNGDQLRMGLAVLVLAGAAVVALLVSRPAKPRAPRPPGSPPASPRAALRAHQAGVSRPPAPVPGVPAPAVAGTWPGPGPAPAPPAPGGFPPLPGQRPPPPGHLPPPPGSFPSGPGAVPPGPGPLPPPPGVGRPLPPPPPPEHRA